MKFKKTLLIEMIVIGPPVVIVDEIVEHNRWAVRHRMIFQHHGRFYETKYRVPATELQDEQPYDAEPDEIECPEVWPISKKVTVYEKLPLIEHGKNCPKVLHVGPGYLHGDDDDTPYGIDGIAYCGRCHWTLA